eukprot:TRINITY_DN9202_c0_g1_i2.p3 TRINITY_DN9202_c0_g1~~TRINITY_DN9202_c0_g1_i2.p3  ORF type:complete len:126 (-),score=1.09 TRINITY_DN9202_c0_g1_i2:921-1298(-)
MLFTRRLSINNTKIQNKYLHTLQKYEAHSHKHAVNTSYCYHFWQAYVQNVVAVFARLSALQKYQKQAILEENIFATQAGKYGTYLLPMRDKKMYAINGQIVQSGFKDVVFVLFFSFVQAVYNMRS